MILVAALVLVWVAPRVGGRRQFTTITGQLKNSSVFCGAQRWAFLSVLLLVIAVVLTVAGKFMTASGFINIVQACRLDDWGTVFREPQLLRSLANTLQLRLDRQYESACLPARCVRDCAQRLRFAYTELLATGRMPMTGSRQLEC